MLYARLLNVIHTGSVDSFHLIVAVVNLLKIKTSNFNSKHDILNSKSFEIFLIFYNFVVRIGMIKCNVADQYQAYNITAVYIWRINGDTQFHTFNINTHLVFMISIRSIHICHDSPAEGLRPFRNCTSLSAVQNKQEAQQISCIESLIFLRDVKYERENFLEGSQFLSHNRKTYVAKHIESTPYL